MKKYICNQENNVDDAFDTTLKTNTPTIDWSMW